MSQGRSSHSSPKHMPSKPGGDSPGKASPCFAMCLSTARSEIEMSLNLSPALWQMSTLVFRPPPPPFLFPFLFPLPPPPFLFPFLLPPPPFLLPFLLPTVERKRRCELHKDIPTSCCMCEGVRVVARAQDIPNATHRFRQWFLLPPLLLPSCHCRFLKLQGGGERKDGAYEWAYRSDIFIMNNKEAQQHHLPTVASSRTSIA